MVSSSSAARRARSPSAPGHLVLQPLNRRFVAFEDTVEAPGLLPQTPGLRLDSHGLEAQGVQGLLLLAPDLLGGFQPLLPGLDPALQLPGLLIDPGQEFLFPGAAVGQPAEIYGDLRQASLLLLPPRRQTVPLVPGRAELQTLLGLGPGLALHPAGEAPHAGVEHVAAPRLRSGGRLGGGQARPPAGQDEAELADLAPPPQQALAGRLGAAGEAAGGADPFPVRGHETQRQGPVPAGQGDRRGQVVDEKGVVQQPLQQRGEVAAAADSFHQGSRDPGDVLQVDLRFRGPVLPGEGVDPRAAGAAAQVFQGVEKPLVTARHQGLHGVAQDGLHGAFKTRLDLHQVPEDTLEELGAGGVDEQLPYASGVALVPGAHPFQALDAGLTGLDLPAQVAQAADTGGDRGLGHRPPPPDRVQILGDRRDAPAAPLQPGLGVLHRPTGPVEVVVLPLDLGAQVRRHLLEAPPLRTQTDDRFAALAPLAQKLPQPAVLAFEAGPYRLVLPVGRTGGGFLGPQPLGDARRPGLGPFQVRPGLLDLGGGLAKLAARVLPLLGGALHGPLLRLPPAPARRPAGCPGHGSPPGSWKVACPPAAGRPRTR